MNTKMLQLVGLLVVAPSLLGYCVYYQAGDGSVKKNLSVTIYKDNPAKAFVVGQPADYASLPKSYAEHSNMTPGSEACWNWKEINSKLFGGKKDQNALIYFGILDPNSKQVGMDTPVLATGAFPIGGGLFISYNKGVFSWKAYTYDDKLVASS